MLAHGSLHLHCRWFSRSGNQAGRRHQVQFSSRQQCPAAQASFLHGGRSEQQTQELASASCWREGGRPSACRCRAREAAAPSPGDGHPCAPVGVLAVAVSPRPERQSGSWTVDTGTRSRGVEERPMQLRVTYFFLDLLGLFAVVSGPRPGLQAGQPRT